MAFGKNANSFKLLKKIIMDYNSIRHIVLNTIAASAADLVVNNQTVYIGKSILGKYKNLVGGSTRKETAITSETAGVVTVTPPGTVVNDVDYGFYLTQWNPSARGASPKYVSSLISVHTPATGSLTATTLCNQFRNEYFALQNMFHVAATGTSTLILTADAGSPVIYGSATSLSSLSSPVTLAVSPIGIMKRGVPAAMEALGVPSDLITGAAYTLYSFETDDKVGVSNSMSVQQAGITYLWLLESATNYSTLITRLDEFVASFPSGGSTYSDPEIAAVA